MSEGAGGHSRPSIVVYLVFRLVSKKRNTMSEGKTVKPGSNTCLTGMTFILNGGRIMP